MSTTTESSESKRIIRTSHLYTNYSTTTGNGRRCTPKRDAFSMSYGVDDKHTPERVPEDELQSHGINIVDTKAKNFSNVTPEEVSDYYKSLGEWQNILPKTDYTYSPLSRYYTKKINGNIPIIPNMSRRKLWKVNGEIEDNEVNSCLAKNYEYEERFAESTKYRIVRQITTITRVVRTVVKKIYVNTINTYSSSDSTNSTGGGLLRNAFLLALMALLLYLLFGDHVDPGTVTMPFINLFQLVKNLVFNIYDLTCSSTTFLTSLISTFITNTSHTANTFIVAPIFRVFATTVQPRRSEKPPTASADLDVEAILKRWFDENAENIAGKVVGSNEFLNFINDRFRRQERTEKLRFQEFLQGYNFEKSPFAEKLKSLEAEVSKWRVEHAESLKRQINLLREEMTAKEGQVQKEIFVILASLVDTDESPDQLKDKFSSLFQSVEEAHRKIDTLASDFNNYTNNASENSHITDRLRDELNYDLKLSIEQMVSQRLNQWREPATVSSIKFNRIEMGEKYINELIQRAIEIYDADKTGKPDFALESQGGIILSTRCTETKTANAQFSIFGIPLWHASRSPRTVIQPGVHPGECWAFPGSTGYLVIQLSKRILVTGFTLEHIPRSLASNGTIDSAPKDFGVWALHRESDPEPRFLGEFRYDDQGSSVQYFEAIRLDEPYQIVELKILSNHGKMDYTCLYRFRVHGIPM